MAQMAKVTIDWTGFPGGPGFTNFYFRDFSGSGAIDQAIVDAAVTKTDALLNAVAPSIPSGVTCGVSATVEAIEETTGELQAFWTGTPEAAAAGTGTSSYAAPVGMNFSWYTSTVKNGRRIRGRSFFVPLSTVAFDSDGTLTAARMTTFNTAAAAFIGTGTAADLGVWSRPTAAAPTSGEWALVTSFRVPDQAAVLTSRRS